MDELVEHLQSTYSEYGRKKRNAFRSQIDKSRSIVAVAVIIMLFYCVLQFTNS